MILAGPKSYYDEYLRKKGTNKTLSDPPSLLTDRGAYVNFLEVQLERVSAACLSVQSYEDRFQDQHGMVHALEQRCSSMTKLLSLAQQCTEEVRVEANQGIERISKEFQLYKAEQQRINESYKQRIEALECIINDSFPDFGSKLKLMQQKSDEQEQLQQAQIEDLTQQQQQLEHQCEVLTTSQVEVQQLIENNRATISRVTFDVEEHSARANNFMRNAEQRLQQQADEHRDQLDNKLSSLQAKISQEQERLQEQWDAQSHEVQAAVREHYGRMSREVQAMRSQCEEEVETVAARVQDDLEQRYGKLRKSLDSSVAEIRAEGERQREQLLQLEEEMLSQVGGVQQTVSQLSDRQEQLSIAHDKSQLVTTGELTALQRRAKRQSERVDQLDSRVASFAEENSRSISAVETNMRSLHEEALMASEALQQQHVADKEELLRLHEEALGSSRVLEDQQREDRARIQQLLEETMTMSRVMEEHHKHDQDQLHELEAHERQDVELLRKEQQYEIERLQQEEWRWQREQEQRLKLREDEQAERFQQWQQQQRQYPSGQQQHQQQQQQQRSQSQYFMFPHDSVLGSPSVVLPPPHYQQQFANMQQADPRLFSPIRRSQSADYQQGPAYQQFPADASLIADNAEGVGGPMSARKPVKGVTIDIKSSASERRYSSDGRGRPPQQQRGPVQRPSRSRSNDAMQHAPAAAAATAATACKTGSSSSGSSNSSASSDEDNEPLRKALVTLLTSDAKDPDTVRRLLSALSGGSTGEPRGQAAAGKESSSRGEDMLRSFLKSYNRDKREILQRLRELSPKRKGFPGDGAASQGGRGRRAGRSRSSSPSLLDHDTAASQRRKQPLTKEEVGILAKCRADFLAKQNEELNKVIAPSAEVMGGADEQAAPYAAPSAADGDAASSTCPVRAGSRDSERREPTANEVAQGSTPPRSDAVAMRQGLQVGRTSYPVDHRLSAHGQKSDEQFSRYMSAQRTGLQNLSSSNNSISRSYSSMQLTEKQALTAIDAIEQLEAGRSLSPSARRAAGAQRWIPPNTAQLQQRRLSPQTLKLQQRQQQQQQGRPTSAAAPDADREAPRTAHGSRSSVVTSTTSTTTQEYTAH